MAEETTGTSTAPEERTLEQKVADLVRACLLSVNEEISAPHLDRDFTTMIGYHIPYKKFGFSSLESYFESLSDINLRRAANGSLILSAGISKNTEHIFHLIAQQKPAKRRVHKLKKKNFRAGDDGDEYAKWMEPRDSDDGYGEVYVKCSPQSNAPPKRDNSSPNYRRPANMPPYAENRSYRAPNSVQKPPGSRYVGRNFDPNYHQRFKGPDGSPRFVPRGRSPTRSADRGNFGATRCVPRGRSPARSAESDTSSNFGKDAGQESVIDADYEKTEESPEVTVEKEEGEMVEKPIDLPIEEMSEVLKINDDTDDKGTDGIGIAAGAEPKVEEEPFGPKKFLMLGLARRQKEMEQRQAELAKKYNRECADFLDKTTTLEEYIAGNNFCALQEFLKIQSMPSAELKIEFLPPKYCEIRIHHFVFCGFPEETQSLKERLEDTAADAMCVLRTLDLAIEKDINEPLDHINRILTLVYARPSGIWRSYISQAYSLKYNEEPPENWADTFLAKVQDVAIVRLIGSPNDLLSEIWKPKLVTITWKPEMLSPTATSPTIIGPLPSRPVQRTRSLQPPREFAPSVPCFSAPNSPPPAHLEQLQLVPRKSYPIVVNHVGPETSLWVRVAGGEYGMVYDRMLSNLATAYADHTQLGEVLVPMVGCCYAAFVRSAWHRVMLTQLRPSGMATVFLLDVGREEMIPFQECRTLVRQFTELPGLAVCCVLDGFEEFTSNTLYLEFLHKVIVNGCFVAEVLSVDSGKASVNLTGTGNLSGLEVNYHIADKLGLAIPTQRILAVGQVFEVRLPHVTMSGSVFVRIEDDAQKLLHLMSHQLEHKLLWQEPKSVREVQAGSRIYFARLLDTENSVYRVIALAQPTAAKMVCVNFIDLGDKAFVPLSCLFELEGFFDSLWRLPPQAIVVSLTSLPPATFTKQMLQRLQELVPADKSVLMKVVGEGLVPEVELFRRLLPENILVSVNNTLALDPTLQGQPVASPSTAAGSFDCAAAMSSDGSAVAKRADQNCLPLKPPTPFLAAAGPYMLQPPTIPPVGAQFDVHVPMVSNPNNFIVQPWNSYYGLQEIMFELQQVYTGSGCENSVAATEIAPGHAYAALHPDGSWYRVSASSQVINEDSVLASFSDYGDLQVLQLTNMRHLAPRFCQLPCQAIRAHLYGVKPLHQDWCVQDCLAFQALVNEQQFVSIVMSKPADVDDPQAASVGLKLIDTSGADDVHLDQLLVNEGKAEFINNGI